MLDDTDHLREVCAPVTRSDCGNLTAFWGLIHIQVVEVDITIYIAGYIYIFYVSKIDVSF